MGSLCMAFGICLGGYYMGHKFCVRFVESQNLADKHLYLVRLYDIWMMAKQNNISIVNYLMNKGIRSIAIYGMSYMGIRLFHELKEGKVCVKYGIDRNPKMRIPELEIYHPNEIKDKEVDAVLVTAIFSFDSIKRDLNEKGFKKILALDEILYDLI
jgi:hypothetical protein